MRSGHSTASAASVATPSVSLHYLSGTGNTYRVAAWIADVAQSRGAQVDIVPISSRVGEKYAPAPVSGRRLLGVLSPTHGFTAPWAALKHAATVPGVRGADVFTVVTRAGSFVGPFRLPGFEGTAAWILAFLLVLRGGHLVGVRAIDMPSNWTSLHWGLNQEHVAAIVSVGKIKASTFAESALAGRTQFTGWLSLILGLLIAPVSLLYLLIARPTLGKLFFADERCTSCGLCAKCCPFGAVHMMGDTPKRPYWTFDCESCMRCMNLCPERAIQASWIAVGAQMIVLLVAFEIVAGAAVLGGMTADIVALLAASILILALTGPVYRVAWLLGRRRPVAWLRGHMTPTRLYRRYREPGTDLRDI